MKLITKINLNFISSASFVLFAGCVVFYVLLRHITVSNIDRELEEHKSVSIKEFDQLLMYPERFLYFDVLIRINRTSRPQSHSFSDTTLVINQQLNHFRKLSFSHRRLGETYQISIFKSLTQTDELIIQLLFALCLLIIFFMLSFYFLNRYVAIRSLEDFFKTISKITQFKVEKKTAIELPQTDVDEFEQLNNVLQEMTKQIQRDFLNLKEFTENASHEIQTPLAIISTKLELLFQDPNLNESQLMCLASIQEAVNRLSKLNKGLLLLTKIENHQFEGREPINIQSIINDQLENLAEFIEEKNLQVKTQFQSTFRPELNSYLAELLIFNVLKNSIKHNIFNGSLFLTYSQNKLTVKNSGENQALELEKLFQRFAKGGKSKSLGLGLAIVKKICDLYAIKIEYTFEDKLHSLSFSFNHQLNVKPT